MLEKLVGLYNKDYELEDIHGFKADLVSQQCVHSSRGCANVALQRKLEAQTRKAPRSKEWHTRTDPGHLQQVILNLVLNAKDAMPGGGHLTIRTVNAERCEAYARQHVGMSPGSYVSLVVADSGVGMDTETRLHVFEPFFTTKPVGKGTGLGLSTVYGLITKIGGYITVESTPGQGTVLTIDLPRIEAPLDGDLVLDDTPSSLQGNETILVAEDETQVREFVIDALREVGYGVLSASSGIETLNTLMHSPVPIDLLLSDLLIPALNAMALREPALVENPHLCLLVMSASSHEKLIVWVEEKGCRLRPTPFRTDYVLLAVRDVWDRRRHSVRAAITLVTYFHTHAKRVYRLLRSSRADQRAAQACRWIRTHGGSCTVRDLQRHRVTGVRRASEAEKLVRDLIDLGHGQVEEHQLPSGRNQKVFVLHTHEGW